MASRERDSGSVAGARDMRDRIAKDDDPPHSRLFVLAGKGAKKETFEEIFGKYGTVEDVYILKDKRSGDDKGVAYVKFSKFSEAALAMEELNGVRLTGQPKHMKVLIASNRRDGSVRDDNEEEKYLRLFVIVPKTLSDEDFKKEFQQYGDIEHANVLKDKQTGTSKGFGYVKFKRPYHAALALEECDPVFKAKLAEPKRKHQEREQFDRQKQDMDYGFDRGDKRGFRDAMWQENDSFGSFYPDGRGRGSRFDTVAPQMSMQMGPGSGAGLMGQMPSAMSQLSQISPMMTSLAAANSMKSSMAGPMEMLSQYSHTGQQRLHITCSVGLTQKCLSRLLNFIPGLDYCDLNESTGVAYARYTTPQCSAYARDKLDGFEYPIGCKMYARFAESPSEMDSYGNNSSGSSADVYSKAASVLEQAGINPNLVLTAADNITERVRYCSNLELPRQKPLMPVNSEVVRRLFVVCQPEPVPDWILRDAFCRFGNLIDVFLLPGKNYGYAKYTNDESACAAMRILHGQTLAGQRVKVLEANAQRSQAEREGNDWPSKKPRI